MSPDLVMDFELTVKQQLTRLHKDVFGLGPKSVYVKLSRDMLVIKCTGCFTTLEKRLLVEKGHDYVLDLRRCLVLDLVKQMTARRLFGTDVIDFHLTILPMSDAMHCFFVLKDDIEQLLSLS
ncbi:MAG: Na-translocating system protein MpsC family protein [Bacillota bacterium]|nr:Na-translocating system protein MpsC family protein [Bacillota bacterium]